MLYEKEICPDNSIPNMNKSVDNLLLSSHEVLSSINTSTLSNVINSKSVNERLSEDCYERLPEKNEMDCTSMVNLSLSPQSSPKIHNRREQWKNNIESMNSSPREIENSPKVNDSSLELMSRAVDSHCRSSTTDNRNKDRSTGRRKKKSWYNVLYPTYKSRSEDFKRIFKDVPDDERLVVDYGCALQREILVHGRLYVSQNYVCFYANIFTWETIVSLRWKDVASITKEKTALVIPNAISICTKKDKFFLTTFGARDKTYLMLFRVWQNALIGQPLSTAEMWQLVHACYGEELGLTSDDEDYIPPSLTAAVDKFSSPVSTDLHSELEVSSPENIVSSIIEPVIASSAEQSSESKADINLDLTDMSDTTESETEKQALDIGIESSSTCTASHEGRKIISATLPIHVDQLFTLLFTNSKFFLDFQIARKTTDLIQSAWVEDPQTCQKTRNVSLTVVLTQLVGPRTSQVSETQIMLPCTKPGHRYCIDANTINAGIPYADSFCVQNHFCLAAISENESSLSIYSQIKFTKHVWSMPKRMIEKNAWAGLEEYFGSLTKALTVECEVAAGGNGLKRKAKRRRRALCTVPLQSQTSDLLLPSNLSPTIVESSHISNVSKIREDTTSIVNWFLLIAVLCLMIINGLLYYKLWGLEDAAAYTIMDLHVLKNTPKSEEEWINLLQQQESLHNVEMRKWQRVLHTAIQLLKQTEESLTELQKSMHPSLTEKMFSILKPNLKGFYNEHAEGRHNEDM